MNNNRGSNNSNNNRRRGRGNRPGGGGGGGGGGQQLNRIDSRARGNAPQLLEKYRKLAHDAHLNGDRVQAEYYLQFADHYFRVLADQRLRQEEQRRPRDERGQEGGEGGERFESDDAGEFSTESDFPSFDQPVYTRRERDDRPRPQQQPREERLAEDDAPRAEVERTEVEPATANAYEPAENPFVRDNRESRGTRGLRPRRDDRRPRRDEQSDDGEAPGLDPSLLPPAIGVPREVAEVEADEVEAKPRRGRPRKPRAGDDAGEALESVN